MDQGFDVYCGLDVGKSEHHATALNRAGERLFDKPLPQDEARLRELFTTLPQHGKVLMVVDQPNTIGALPVAVDRDSEVLSARKLLAGFDADLTHECTRALNRLRSLLLQIFPALERAFPGTVLTRPLVLDLLVKYAGPTGLRGPGQSNVLRWAAQPQPQRPGCPHRRHLHRVRRADRDRHRNRSRRTRHPRVAAQIKELKHQRTIVAARSPKNPR